MRNWKPDMKKILKKGIISPRLHEAVTAILQALEDKDLDLAYQLSACKSLICAADLFLDSNAYKKNAFWENREHNDKVLTASVYVILDTFHHDVAWELDKLPSGRMTVSQKGKNLVYSEMKPKGMHTIVRRIRFEKNQIRKEAERRMSR